MVQATPSSACSAADRAVLGHARKFAATLQEAQAGDAPVLLRVETRAGRGMGKSAANSIAEHANVPAFLVEVLDATTGR